MQLPRRTRAHDPQAPQPARRPDPGTQPRRRRRQPGGDRSARRRSGRARRAAWCCCRNCTTAPYFCQHEAVERIRPAPKPIPGPSTERLAQLAKQHGVVLVSSLFERRAAGPVPQHRGGLRSRRHASPASTARCTSRTIRASTRSSTSRPGDLGFEPIDTSVGRLGVLVCWDQWYPEGARLMALAGAELLLYPTAIGWDPGRRAGGEGSPAQRLDPQPPRPRGRQRPAGAELQSRRPRAVAAGRLAASDFWGSQPRARPAGRVPRRSRPATSPRS